VIGLSHSLGVQTVAEGVETEHDAQALRGLGCGMAQGYLFGRRCRPNGSSAR
jgi:EAL domain-containing protein (putative c-di-GMP-specific phosphodiesterase class I)